MVMKCDEKLTIRKYYDIKTSSGKATQGNVHQISDDHLLHTPAESVLPLNKVDVIRKTGFSTEFMLSRQHIFTSRLQTTPRRLERSR